MNTPHPQSGVSARARHIRPTSQMPAHFSVQLSLVLALSAYSVHALAQDATPDVVTSAARAPQVVTDAPTSTTGNTRAEIQTPTVREAAR